MTQIGHGDVTNAVSGPVTERKTVTGISRSFVTVIGANTAAVVMASGYATLIDIADVPLVAQWAWRHAKCRHSPLGYVRNKHGHQLHRLIISGGERIDHKSGDTLDNRRANLRPCTHKENCRNRRGLSKYGYKGVYKQNRGGGYGAQIRSVDFNIKHLGTYPTIEEAARAYDRAALEHFGEFARLNFPILAPEQGGGAA